MNRLYEHIHDATAIPPIALRAFSWPRWIMRRKTARRSSSRPVTVMTPRLLTEVRALLAAHEAMPTEFLAVPAVEGIRESVNHDVTIQHDPRLLPTPSSSQYAWRHRAVRRAHRALQALAGDRRGRLRHGLDGGAVGAGHATRGAQDHQAGHGHAGGHRALRGRAAGAGDDGPPEHRQGLRRGRHRQGPALTSSWNW